jgi:energy-coupling factor transporter ATP-binding protein EcfA2
MSSPGTAAIDTERLTRRFGSKVAAADLDLRVERGEVVDLLGDNGAEKTTSAQLLGGSWLPAPGSTHWRPTPSTTASAARARHHACQGWAEPSPGIAPRRQRRAGGGNPAPGRRGIALHRQRRKRHGTGGASAGRKLAPPSTPSKRPLAPKGLLRPPPPRVPEPHGRSRMNRRAVWASAGKDLIVLRHAKAVLIPLIVVPFIFLVLLPPLRPRLPHPPADGRQRHRRRCLRRRAGTPQPRSPHLHPPPATENYLATNSSPGSSPPWRWRGSASSSTHWWRTSLPPPQPAVGHSGTLRRTWGRRHRLGRHGARLLACPHLPRGVTGWRARGAPAHLAGGRPSCRGGGALPPSSCSCSERSPEGWRYDSLPGGPGALFGES